MIDFKLQANDKITFFMVNGLAMTTKKEVIVIKETATEVIFKEGPRKRKAYSLKKDKVPLLFLGHNIIFGSDMDGSCMRGNACINLVSTFSQDDVRLYIKENNKAKMTDHDMAHILLFTHEQADDSSYEECLANCLYPDTEYASGIIQRFREKI